MVRAENMLINFNVENSAHFFDIFDCMQPLDYYEMLFKDSLFLLSRLLFWFFLFFLFSYKDHSNDNGFISNKKKQTYELTLDFSFSDFQADKSNSFQFLSTPTTRIEVKDEKIIITFFRKRYFIFARCFYLILIFFLTILIFCYIYENESIIWLLKNKNKN